MNSDLTNLLRIQLLRKAQKDANTYQDQTYRCSGKMFQHAVTHQMTLLVLLSSTQIMTEYRQRTFITKTRRDAT